MIKIHAYFVTIDSGLLTSKPFYNNVRKKTTVATPAKPQ